MKANELESKDLMIGDLVYACIEEEIVGEAKYKIISKIRDLEANGDFTVEFVGVVPDELDWQDGEDISWIEPVPLTAEILEKNFEKKTFYGIYDDYFDFDIREYSDSIYVATFHNCEASFPDQSVTLSFVHELQHFLNHCGIEREIKI